MEAAEGIAAMRKICQDMASRRLDVPKEEKITWYYRHWKEHENSERGLASKSSLPDAHILDADWTPWMKDDPRNPMSMAIRDKKAAERKEANEMKKLAKKQKN